MMTLQDWGALGELVGGVAIIVSLVYVGLQIKQSTAAARAATSQAFSEQYSTIILQITKSGFRDIFWRGKDGLENLKGSEIAAFMALLATIVRFGESFYFQRQEGSIDSRLFDAWLVQTLDLFAQKGPREYWAIRGHQFNPEFVAFFEAKMAASKPKPMYKPESE
jgi:hypothetical protein